MSDEMWSVGVYKTRSALGDVTNLVGKRGFSLISTSGVKSGDDHKKDEGLRFGKKECLRTENFKKENFRKEIVDCVLRPHSCSEIDSLKGNAMAGKSKVPCDTREPGSPGVRENVNSDTAVKCSDAVRDGCLFTQLSPIKPSDRGVLDVRGETEKDERIDSEVVMENASKEQVENSISMDDDKNLTLDNLDFSKGDYLDCFRFPESQESRSGGLEKSLGQKGDGCSSMGMDLIKACPCSFCMKAAYIWSDLHYQDVKGRIAALKKSQKEARIFVQRNSRDNGIGNYRHGNADKFLKLEFDLTDQWRSLFLHMEDIFVCESSQLESSLSTLKGLRDNCKTDLDLMHSGKQ